MLKTENYQLNKPEPADPLRVADFNENADIIDGALGELATTVAAKGNCTIVAGTYTGTGEFGYGYNTTLTFGKQPLAVFIGGGGYSALLIQNNSHGISVDHNGTVRTMNLTWNTNGSVSWYSSANYGHQMNASGTAYTYLALLN